MKISPAELRVLLDIYTKPGKFDDHQRFEESLRRFLDQGVIWEEDGKPRGHFLFTQKGQKWIDMMLSTPQPESRWIDPREAR